ncbi:MAG: hypothetical protein IJ741_10535, partial [Schwartzia sp.]|nr:hypothetical protein [Schwartzia sp. (in: firmicutes)]
DQEITRYEMAQMIARAMAKGGNGADKALIDKLAAEFADELNNLGVRVAALEKKVDNVKWTGKVRYRYINRHESGQSDRANDGGKGNINGLLLRLEPQMTINKNWTAKARIDYNNNREMENAANMSGNNLTVDRAWVEGKYNNFVLKLGKFNVATQADYSMSMFYRIAGAEAQFGKDIKVAVRGGRLNLTNANAFAHGGNSNNFGITRGAGAATADPQVNPQTATYYGIEVFNDRAKKFTWGLGWQRVGGNANDTLSQTVNGVVRRIGDNVNIFNLGLGWKFDKNVQIRGAWAFATGIKDRNDGGSFDSKGYKNAASLEVLYKGAVASKPNSWGFNIAYRHLGDVATIYPYAKEFGPQNGGEKGFEIGVSYTFLKNIVGNAKYFNGKELLSGNKTNTVWTELNFIF